MKSVWNRINWLIVAFVVTIAYITFIVWKVEFWKIWDFLSEPKLNEIGDFLAGVFSPLAFIWLVAAVLTQRQELTETRDQFAENQKVVDAQLKTINEQSDLLQQQHELAEKTAQKTYRLSLFEERYKIYEEFIAFGKKHEKRKFNEPAYSEFLELLQKSTFVFGKDIEIWFHEISEAIYRIQELWDTEISQSFSDSRGIFEIYSSPEVEIEYKQLSKWLREQFFSPVERTEKFSDSMRVSDK
ncbi:hypothetical protein G6L16_021345 [Agrobacterium tumefaciens]|uniref:hypothetical protein n=1 Tax=Agrobacterium tumefaciens TaxID=358 RepID=UPI00157174B0|nr:hypothetical protein [Agrobacterium tumefaciens]NSZ64631.1 hypothetical protein [Agrobacterium tumefaciens]NTA71001.1 hypothetical protein [Agrobacterium tumefaciens]WIE40745.1 hypothetical protein G6L16_021345 [Agrobacterium tumefaciens]